MLGADYLGVNAWGETVRAAPGEPDLAHPGRRASAWSGWRLPEQRPHLDAAADGRRAELGDLHRVLQVAGLDHGQAADDLRGVGERAFRDHVAAAGGGRRGRL